MTNNATLFAMVNDTHHGDYTNQELRDLALQRISSAISYMRSKQEQVKTEYCINKKAIQCAFNNNCGKSQFYKVLLRLTLIDSMYSTQMRMRPYGLGELAEVISMLGTDVELSEKFVRLHNQNDLSDFDYLKSHMKLYRDGSSSVSSNLFREGFGLEKAAKSKKRALSLITKYAYFLTRQNFPIYDSLVVDIFLDLWDIINPTITKPNIKTDDIIEYRNAIDDLRSTIGYSITYDELDSLLWRIGKITNNSLTLVLSMEDYINVNGDVDNLCKSSLVSTDPVLDACITITRIIQLKRKQAYLKKQ